MQGEAESDPTIVRHVLEAISAVWLGRGVVLLLWAAGLSLRSRLAAGPALGYGSWDDYRGGADTSTAWTLLAPNTIALTVCGVAVILLGTLAVVRWWPGFSGSSLTVILAMIALGYFIAVGRGVWSTYRWMQESPISAWLPTAAAAWVIAAVGAFALIFGAPAVVRQMPDRWWEARIRVLMAVVLAAGATVSAVRAGDDQRFVDATVAAAVPIPATPDRLGQKAFSLKISGKRESQYQEIGYAASAGAGFVTVGDGRVTAYGADGVERWHYPRAGDDDSEGTRLQCSTMATPSSHASTLARRCLSAWMR